MMKNILNSKILFILLTLVVYSLFACAKTEEGAKADSKISCTSSQTVKAGQLGVGNPPTDTTIKYCAQYVSGDEEVFTSECKMNKTEYTIGSECVKTDFQVTCSNGSGGPEASKKYLINVSWRSIFYR